MDRYIDVILYLYFKENDFKELFHSRKGFCLKHFKALLEGTEKYLGPKETAIFVDNLLSMQIENMERIQQEVTGLPRNLTTATMTLPGVIQKMPCQEAFKNWSFLQLQLEESPRFESKALFGSKTRLFAVMFRL